ncbi:hypothetical protein [Companilactobacillus halodurans]|uniref:Uncharacterized protein n=1 Tax=Companilactobacillus halodurans TaxID=2584183 RepID=A0A5P0ZNB2_9LACO|nr:hypothetical protein [Companilactobacillus halodurans]MQS75705.1 hypothetical protein [Companilactobacillus halodurans]MQS97647.1 hypothetical protein [Companilactobacillus halodurans]
MLTLMATNASSSGTPLLIAIGVAILVIIWLFIKTGIALLHHPIIGIVLILLGVLGLWNYLIIGIGVIVGGIVFLVISQFFDN